MEKLSPFLYFFQDPATVFAFHLIYTHNVIHWYLLVILFFVYFSIAALVRRFTWNTFSKSRGVFRPLLSSSMVVVGVQKGYFSLTYHALAYGLTYYFERATLGIYALFEVRDDDQSYIYYYYSEQLLAGERLLKELDLPFTLGRELELFPADPNLRLARRLTAEANYLTAIVSYVPREHILHNTPRLPPKAKSMLNESPSWILHRNLDSYFTSYFSREYSAYSWLPQEAFLAAQKGNDSLNFEYICVFLPTLIVFIILGHSLSLLYSGSDEITPGLHFTAVGHQGFGSYELEALIIKNYEIKLVEGIELLKGMNERKAFIKMFGRQGEGLKMVCDEHGCRYDEALPEALTLRATFDSIPVIESSLGFGSKRLLEVDNPLVLPVGVPLKALATSGDVLHSGAVPEMGIKIDAVPGRINDSLSFLQRPGIFYGQCSELCGVGHGFMPIVVEALAIPNFISWTKRFEDLPNVIVGPTEAQRQEAWNTSEGKIQRRPFTGHSQEEIDKIQGRHYTS